MVFFSPLNVGLQGIDDGLLEGHRVADGPRGRERLPTFICVVQVHILDGAQRGRGWLENASPPEMAVEESPLGPLCEEASTAHRDRRENSLCREPSAGYSKGLGVKRRRTRRWLWRRDPSTTPGWGSMWAKSFTGHTCSTPRGGCCSPAGLKMTRPTFWPSSRRSSPSQRKSSGRPTSPGAARHCCWRFCGRKAKR